MSRGRKSALTVPFTRDVLLAIAEERYFYVSNYYLEQLADQGLLNPVMKKITDGPGRPTKVFVLTGKGRGRLAILKNAGKKASNFKKAA